VWIGTFLYRTALATNPGNRERAESVGLYPFGPQLRFAASSSGFLLGFSDSSEVTLMGFDGRPVRRLALPAARRAFLRQELGVVRDRALEFVTNTRTREILAAKYDPRHLPRYQPLFGSLHGASGDDLWVESFRVDDNKPGAALVVDALGQARASVALPGRFKLMSIGASFIAGVCRRPDETEFGCVFSLIAA
jgi:hypothetical protein